MTRNISFEEFDCPPEQTTRDQRESRMLMVPIRGRRFGEGQATIRNISPGGLGGTTTAWVAPDDEIDVRLPAYGWVTARVAWVEGPRFGLSFEGRIDPARITRDSATGMAPKFQVMDRYRPEESAKRPPINKH
jgi:hypothetical protein